MDELLPQWEKFILWVNENLKEVLVKGAEAPPCGLVTYVFRAENASGFPIKGLNLPLEDKDLIPYLEKGQIQFWSVGAGLHVYEDGVLRAEMPVDIPAREALELRFTIRILGEECAPLVSPWEEDNPGSRWVRWPELLATETPTPTDTASPTAVPTETQRPSPEPSLEPTAVPSLTPTPASAGGSRLPAWGICGLFGALGVGVLALILLALIRAGIIPRFWRASSS